MDKIVYFVRHGQSLGNAAAIFQPPESPLSPTGRGQAACIAKRIAKLAVQALLSSPYQRAKETAEVINRGLTPEYSGLFVERMKPPCINGKPVADEAAHAIWREWNRSLYTPGMRVQGGENYDDLIAPRGRGSGLSASARRGFHRRGDPWLLLADDGWPAPARRYARRGGVQAVPAWRGHGNTPPSPRCGITGRAKSRAGGF